MWRPNASASRILVLLMVLFSMSAGAREVVDVTGRTVVVPDHVERVLLGEGRLIYSLALLERSDLTERVVGWQGDFRMLDVQGYQAFQRSFPDMAEIPLVGGSSAQTFSVEKALALAPDVVFLTVTGGHGPGSGSAAVRQLEKASVPVVYVDFSAHPLTNTLPSIRAMGQVLERDKEAEAFIRFYRQQLKRVASVLDSAREAPEFHRPTVFLDMLAGLRDCCGSPGEGNLGELIALAGGENIGAKLIPGPFGTLNPEYILTRDPEVYIATGVFAGDQGGVTLGYQATRAAARRSLEAVAHRDATSALTSVREGRVYGLWHIFYDSPEHFLAVQALARWLHPELFPNLDPYATRAEFYRRFMPIPETGVLFTELSR
ncbi:ABC transporter substrate-binding protein [Marinobacter oulmenensis]|uniref:Iron complex transport system substrate-binding protein n=1 Tax=Marinobacter oulmenensis TaxID=643747 RepID=A0A840U764_9GAMM|nr:ABC transporter substrate-binding protein [Marinobacter oulmenensis]MBB5320959.1 iron complex transport system substrate-binding protein [Marinobacter oulmenensis]